MPVLARRADQAKADSEGKRRNVVVIGAVAAVVVAALGIWLAVRSPEETDDTSDTAADNSGTAATANTAASASPTSKPSTGKGKAKWRTPRKSGD